MNNTQKEIEKERNKIIAKVRFDEIEKEYCEKIRKASIKENCEEMLNLFYELNVYENFIKRKDFCDFF
jgi:hypothetical protein